MIPRQLSISTNVEEEKDKGVGLRVLVVASREKFSGGLSHNHLFILSEF